MEHLPRPGIWRRGTVNVGSLGGIVQSYDCLRAISIPLQPRVARERPWRACAPKATRRRRACCMHARWYRACTRSHASCRAWEGGVRVARCWLTRGPHGGTTWQW